MKVEIEEQELNDLKRKARDFDLIVKGANGLINSSVEGSVDDDIFLVGEFLMNELELWK